MYTAIGSLLVTNLGTAFIIALVLWGLTRRRAPHVAAAAKRFAAIAAVIAASGLYLQLHLGPKFEALQQAAETAPWHKPRPFALDI